MHVSILNVGRYTYLSRDMCRDLCVTSKKVTDRQMILKYLIVQKDGYKSRRLITPSVNSRAFLARFANH